MGRPGIDPERRINRHGFWWVDSLMTAQEPETRLGHLQPRMEARQTERASLANRYLALKDRRAEAKRPEKMAP